jgi:putative ABC transport system permease protein
MLRISPFSFRQIRVKPLRSLLTLFSISLGVALYTSIDIVNFSTLKSFENGIDSITGKAKLTLMAGENGFDESILEKVEKSSVVKNAIPLIETQVFYQSPITMKTETLVVLGVDLLKESSVRAYQAENQEVIDDPLTFLNQPDSIILTREFADHHGLKLESKFKLATAHGSQWFTVRGLLKPEGPAKAYGGNLAIMDIDGARMQFGKIGKIDRIDIIPQDQFKLEDVRTQLEKEFSPALQVESPETQAENMKKLVEGYQGLLSFFGLLAMIVGLFLVMNTTNISIAERRREFGILRAVGATRSGILRILAEEAILMGWLGSLIGVGLGKFIAEKMESLITVALSTQYLIPVFVKDLELSTEQWVKGMGWGTTFTLVAALIAGRNTLKIEPIEAAKGKVQNTSTPNLRYPLIGLMMLALIVIDSRLGLSHQYPIIRSMNPFLLIFGSVMASPILVRTLIRLLRLIFPFPTIRLASDNLLQNASRTSSNIMTLMVGLMLVIILSLSNHSIKHSITSWFDRTLAADLLVSSKGKLLTFQVQPLNESVKMKLDQLAGVDIAPNGIGCTGLRYVKQKFGGKTLAIKAFDRLHPRLEKNQFEITEGNPESVMKEFYDSPHPVILVSQNFVMKFKKSIGDVIELSTPTGLHAFKIIGVVAEFTNPEGVFYLNRELYRKLWNDPLLSGIFVMAKNGIDPRTIRAEMDHAFGSEMGLMATLNADLSVQARQLIDESFTYTKAIEWSALLVALFGLFNTLMVSVIERTRELGVLRAVGMTRSQLVRMILAESLIQGSLGGMVAVMIGVFVTYFWLMGTLSSLMGWVMQFALPWPALVKTVFLGVIVGIFAGLAPAQRVSRLQIRDALETE